VARRRPDAEVEAAAAGDPDNPPLTAEQRGRTRRVVAVGSLRRLGLTQAELARRYRLPVGTLRDVAGHAEAFAGPPAVTNPRDWPAGDPADLPYGPWGGTDARSAFRSRC
jgi:hypothetical protein